MLQSSLKSVMNKIVMVNKKDSIKKNIFNTSFIFDGILLLYCRQIYIRMENFKSIRSLEVGESRFAKTY